ncbi:MAG: hypothetical protein ACI9IV_001756 [Paracoccaceae bacterium]|mgnify:CR=1 FL=1|jgi:hypothetical protein
MVLWSFWKNRCSLTARLCGILILILILTVAFRNIRVDRACDRILFVNLIRIISNRHHPITGRQPCGQSKQHK